MQLVDYIILFSYFLMSLGFGTWFAQRQKTRSEFILAGRSMHWFPVGLAIMITAFSAINYTGFSGEVFSHGLYVTLSIPVFIMVAWPITRIIMPFYHRMGLYSAYEYLEKRFDIRVRCLASGLFIIWRLFWMAVTLYVPCKVLTVITGLDLLTLIMLVGACVIAYTTIGGMKGVILTDVFQFFVLLTGIVIGVTWATMHTSGGFVGMLRLAAEHGLMKPFYPFDPQMFSLDPRIRITLWSCWIGTLTVFMTRYGVDQVIVQHYFTARSLQHAQRAFHWNYACAISALLLLVLMGFGIYAYASSSGLLDSSVVRPEYYFSRFIQSLPAGITGLIVAGLFAATMSSMDAGLHACGTALTTDFINRFASPSSELTIFQHRCMTFMLGLTVILMAMTMDRLGSIFEIANKIVNGFGSPLLAITLLGMFSRRATSRGMLIGGVLGAVWSATVSFTVTHLALHYYAVVNFIGTLACCVLFSLLDHWITGEPTSRQLAWTWRARRMPAPPLPGS